VMEKIDLEAVSFTQAQVLSMIPTLTAKNLQNWNDRKILEMDGPTASHRRRKPGRQPGSKRRKYTAVGVIGLRAMSYLVGLGIKPSEAADLGQKVMERALTVHETHPYREIDGVLTWVIDGSEPNKYHRGYIYRFHGKHMMLIFAGEMPILQRIEASQAYITIEVDILIIKALCRIYAAVAGKPLSEEFIFTFDDGKKHQEAEEMWKDIIKLFSKYKTPGSDNEQ